MHVCARTYVCAREGGRRRVGKEKGREGGAEGREVGEILDRISVSLKFFKIKTYGNKKSSQNQRMQ